MKNFFSEVNRSHKLKNGGNETVKEKKLSTRNDLTIFGTCSLKLLDQFTDQKKTVKEHLTPRKFPIKTKILFDLTYM